MRLFSTFTLVFSLCAFGLYAETRIVNTTSQGKTTTSSTEVSETSESGSIKVFEKSELGNVTTLINADNTVKAQESTSKEGTIRMASDGKSVEVTGTWKGKTLGGKYELKDVAFYGMGFEFPLRALARGGFRSLKFPMIDPNNPSKATVMELTRTGTDTYMGRPAIKVKWSLTGLMSALWSAQILMSEDGTVLRYKGNQGPGTPDMVTELVEVKS